MNLRTSLSTNRDAAAETRPTAMVIALSRAPARRFRRDVPTGSEPMGQILFFTGVRYERMPEAPVEPAVRQRKRS
jgi:hypothetical protein